MMRSNLDKDIKIIKIKKKKIRMQMILHRLERFQILMMKNSLMQQAKEDFVSIII